MVVRQGTSRAGGAGYRHAAQKRDDAIRFVREEDIPWDVVIDDVDGRVHAQYGLLPDPSCLIGTDGQVAFYSYWTHVPTRSRRYRDAALLRA